MSTSSAKPSAATGRVEQDGAVGQSHAGGQVVEHEADAHAAGGEFPERVGRRERVGGVHRAERLVGEQEGVGPRAGVELGPGPGQRDALALADGERPEGGARDRAQSEAVDRRVDRRPGRAAGARASTLGAEAHDPAGVEIERDGRLL